MQPLNPTSQISVPKATALAYMASFLLNPRLCQTGLTPGDSNIDVSSERKVAETLIIYPEFGDLLVADGNQTLSTVLFKIICAQRQSHNEAVSSAVSSQRFTISELYEGLQKEMHQAVPIMRAIANKDYEQFRQAMAEATGIEAFRDSDLPFGYLIRQILESTKGVDEGKLTAISTCDNIASSIKEKATDDDLGKLIRIRRECNINLFSLEDRKAILKVLESNLGNKEEVRKLYEQFHGDINQMLAALLLNPRQMKTLYHIGIASLVSVDFTE